MYLGIDCADNGAGVKALGVSGQQHGLVVLDEAMRVIRPGDGDRHNGR
jgi:sugar (pentulose or hexulose) kinase